MTLDNAFDYGQNIAVCGIVGYGTTFRTRDISPYKIVDAA